MPFPSHIAGQFDTVFDAVFDLNIASQRGRRVFNGANGGQTNYNGKKICIIGHKTEWYTLGMFSFIGLNSVTILGGKFRPDNNTWPIDAGGGYGPASFTFNGCSKVYMEGVVCDNINVFVDNTPSASENGGDAIYIAGKTANTQVRIRQCHLKNIRGVQTPADAHADAIQIGSETMGHCGAVDIWRVTATGNYQLFFFDPQAGSGGNVDGGMDSLRMEQVNTRRTQNVTGFRHYFWYSSVGNWNTRGCPITLVDVWANGSANEGIEGTVWPANQPGQNSQFTDARYQGKIGTDSTSRFMHWPDLPTTHKITGRVRQGIPPNGDFAPEDKIGFNYVPGTDIFADTVVTPPPTLGPAIVGTDTGALSATSVSFTSAQETASVTIPITADTATEGDEYFTVRISNPSGCTIGNDVCRVIIKNATVTQPVLSIPATLTVDEGTKVAVTITRTGAAVPCSVIMETKADTAHYMDDYGGGLVPTRFEFTANETTKTWEFNALADTVANEGDEFVNIFIRDPIGATLGNSTCRVTIKDKTAPPTTNPGTVYAIPKSHNDDNNGGIGQPYYRITKTQDDGSVGTARWAFAEAARTNGGLVLNEVQGYIDRVADTNITGSRKQNMSYIGFTGPGPLVFRGSWNASIRGRNVCIYDMIIERSYNDRGSANGDGMQLISDGAGNYAQKIKFVRCFSSGSQDEALQIYKTRSTQYTDNIQSDISIHWSIFTNPLNKPSLYNSAYKDNDNGQVAHGFHILVGGFIPRTDIQNNLMANGYARSPRYSGPADDFLIANNVIVNWGYAAINLQSEIEFPLTYKGSIIGNVGISGPDTTQNYLTAMHNNAFENTTANPTRIHMSGNSMIRGPGSRSTLAAFQPNAMGKSGTGRAIPTGWTPSAARQDTLTQVVALEQARAIELIELHGGPFPIMRRANPNLLKGVTQAIAQMKQTQTAKIINHENEGPGLSAPAFVHRPLTGDLAPPPDHTNVAQVKAWLKFMEAKVTNNPTIV